MDNPKYLPRKILNVFTWCLVGNLFILVWQFNFSTTEKMRVYTVYKRFLKPWSVVHQKLGTLANNLKTHSF